MLKLLKKVFEFIGSKLGTILNDTLKKGNKYSRTSLTMFSAWMIAIFMALYDFFQNGFRYEVFLTFCGIAITGKIIDVADKKMKDGNTVSPQNKNNNGNSQNGEQNNNQNNPQVLLD